MGVIFEARFASILALAVEPIKLIDVYLRSCCAYSDACCWWYPLDIFQQGSLAQRIANQQRQRHDRKGNAQRSHYYSEIERIREQVENLE